MSDLDILVLLYNIEPIESCTVSALIDIDVTLFDVNLTIWNNGPKTISQEVSQILLEKGYNVNFEETLYNASLSEIYNKFVENSNARNLIILDQDSIISEEHLKTSIFNTDYYLILPMIKCNAQIHYPVVNKKLAHKSESLVGKNKVVSIMSGVTISLELSKLLIDRYGSVFDERFYFYGVDTTFFLRIYHIAGKQFQYKVTEGFEHSLSRLEKKKDELSDFRVKERAYDLGLQFRYYSSLPIGISKLCYHAARIVLSNSKENSVALYLIKAYFTGKHYKNRK